MSKQKSVPLVLLVGVILCAGTGSASVSFRSSVTYKVGTNPIGAAVGDFNGDGKKDLAVVDAGDPNVSDAGGISILLGNGDGTFHSASNLTAGNNPTSAAVGDFDRDGHDDLVVVRSGASGGADKGDVTVFLSNGDASFRAGQVISTFTSPSHAVAVDFNMDGIIDLAVSDLNSVSILLGRGDGTFDAATSYLTVPDFSGVTSAGPLSALDFNDDGKRDLGFGVFHSLEVLVGNGDGTFQQALTVHPFSVTESPAFSADFNHDGNVDVVVHACSVFHPCGEFLLLNNGDGTFSNPPGANVLIAGAYTASDFDGDGNPDLAGISNGLVIFTGKGDGTFQAPLTFLDPSSELVALTADLNNDKAPDIVVINTDNTIGVILNSGTDFSLTVSAPTPGSISPGQSATSSVSLQLLNSFDNPVSLACSVQPVQAVAPTCSLSSDSVSFDSSGKANATLTISAGTLATPEKDSRLNLGAAGWLPMVGCALFGAGAWRARRVKYPAIFILGLITLLSAVALPGCGESSRSKPPTSYTVMITASSHQTSHSTSVNLTVD